MKFVLKSFPGLMAITLAMTSFANAQDGVSSASPITEAAVAERATHRAEFENMSDEERAAAREPRKQERVDRGANRPEVSEERRQARRERMSSMSDDERHARREKMGERRGGGGRRSRGSSGN